MNACSYALICSVLLEYDESSGLYQKRRQSHSSNSPAKNRPFCFVIWSTTFVKLNRDDSISFALPSPRELSIKVMVYQPVLSEGRLYVAYAIGSRNAGMINHTSFDHIQYIYSTRAGRRGRREDQCQVGVEILIQRHTVSEDLSNRCNGTACVWNDGVNFLFW